MSDEPPEDSVDETGEYQPPEISPELRAMFDKIDALLVGLSREEALDTASRFFIDAEGEPRIRYKLHLVHTESVAESTAGPGSDGPPVAEPPAADPSDDEPVYIRDIDLLTPEDLERSERAIESVLATVERRRADRASGVIELSRERYMRLRRRRGLSTPD